MKPRLRQGAAWMILPAIAMIAPLGVALDAARSPARAASYPLSSTPSTVDLSNPLYGGATEFALGSGASILVPGGGGDAVFGPAPQSWTFHNDGTISSASGTGIHLEAGGAIINGASDPAALIDGYYQAAIWANNTAATVINYGSITNYNNATYNRGAIYLYGGGVVDNRAGGAIAGYFGGARIFGGAGTITNDGTIKATGSLSNGIYLGGGGTISNSGEISGTDAAIMISNAGAAITNGASGLISGANYGVLACACSGPSTVTNDGLIEGYTGVSLEQGGLVTNRGTINGTGSFGVTLLATGTVNNTGEITSPTSYGVFLADGGTIVNGSSVNSAAYISGVGITGPAKLVNYGYIGPSNFRGADLSGGPAVITNTGTIAGIASGLKSAESATLNNSGTIAGAAYGVELESGGTVTNTGVITGTSAHGIYISGGVTTIFNGDASHTAALIYGGAYGIYAVGCGCNPAGPLTLTNSGTITGNQAYGVLLTGGTITNGSSSNHNALISGYFAGIDAVYASTTVNNFGIISGLGLPGGGVLLEYGGLVNNYAGARISGYYVGVGMRETGTVNNSGVIITTASATGGGLLPYAGVQMYYGGIVNNNAGGTISGYQAGIVMGDTGTVNNSGVILSSAVQFSGSFLSNTGVGLMYGGVVNNNAGGTISGYEGGVFLLGNGTVNNAGVIAATAQTAGDPLNPPILAGVELLGGGVVNNAAGASITGYGLGVLAASLVPGYASVVNNNGTITATGAHSTGVTVNDGTINNQGRITGASGVLLSQGLLVNGSTSNHGAVIRGGNFGASIGSGTLINYGAISSDLTGVTSGGGAVTNQAGGSITARYTGVVMGGPGTVINNGVITVTGASGGFPPASGVVAYGYYPTDRITVINNAGGTITAETGVISPAYGFTLANYGTITGTNGTAVQGPASGNRLILGEGYRFNGAVAMGGALEWAKGAGNLGSLAALNANFTSLEIDAGSTITNAGGGPVALNLTNKGTLAPGAATSLTGNFVQTSSGVLQTVLGDGSTASLNITGTASLSGGVVVVPDGVSATTYTILTATGGVSGAFTSVSGGTLLLKPSLSYDAKDAFVTLTQQPVATIATAPNQLALAGALDKGVAADPAAFAPLMKVLNNFTDATDLKNALDSLAGESHAGLTALALLEGAGLINAFQQHSQGTIGPNEAPDDPWITGFFQSGHLDGFGFSSLHENVAGAVAGADHVFFPGFRGGVMAGMGAEHANVGPNAKASITYEQLALTADYNDGPWFADGLIGFSHSHGTTLRAISIGGLAATATGHPATDQVIAGAEAGYTMALDSRFSLVPFLGMDLASADAQAFSETGAGIMNLAVAAKTTTSARAILGARFKGVNVDLGGLMLNTGLKMGWAHQFSDLNPASSISFASVAGTGFTVTGAPLPRDVGVVGLGAAVAVADNASIQLRYDGEFSADAASNTVSFGLAVDW